MPTRPLFGVTMTSCCGLVSSHGASWHCTSLVFGLVTGTIISLPCILVANNYTVTLARRNELARGDGNWGMRKTKDCSTQRLKERNLIFTFFYFLLSRALLTAKICERMTCHYCCPWVSQRFLTIPSPTAFSNGAVPKRWCWKTHQCTLTPLYRFPNGFLLSVRNEKSWRSFQRELYTLQNYLEISTLSNEK